MAQKETGVKLSQSAPIMPSKASCPAETYGVAQPVSAATIPSVYNKKLNKLFRGRLVVLPSETSVSEALKRMARYNISSVPVTKGDSVLGFVDTLDFLAYLVKLGGKDFEKSGKLDVDMLKNKTQLFKDAKIGDLVDQSGRDPFHILHGDASLSDAVEQYLKGSHRVAISDDNGGIIGVVSQWTIANYLATVPTDEKEWIPTLRESLSKVQYTKNVFSVSKDERVLDAFVKMHHHKVSALAVLDGSGKLVGNLSASDLKGFQLFLEDFNDLVQTVEQFLNIIRKKQMRKENFVVAVTEDTPVKDIVTKFNEEIIHRVFVVDNQFKPIGVFSLTDLMKILIVDTHSISTFAKPTAISQ